MKWTIRIEVTLDGNGPSTRDVGTITRPIADLSPEQIGLTLEEGQQLLRRIQMAIIGNQVHGYELRRRLCNDCGRRQRIKDTRRKCVQTAFGAFRLRGRRYRVCQCQRREIGPVFFPLGEIIPRRTTPEVRFLFAELGATMPYREASRVLRTCGFGTMGRCELAMPRFGGTRSRWGGIWKHSGSAPLRSARIANGTPRTRWSTSGKIRVKLQSVGAT